MARVVSPLGDRGPRWPWLVPQVIVPVPPHGGCWGLSAKITTRPWSLRELSAQWHQSPAPPHLRILWKQGMGLGLAFSFFFLICGKIHIKFRDADLITRLGRSPWSRKWQPTPVLLPGKSHGQRSLAGYSPWSLRVGHNYTHTHRVYHFYYVYVQSYFVSMGLTPLGTSYE